MKLSVLLSNEKYSVMSGNDNIDVTSIEYDSRKVKNGSVFVCITGFKTDGHKYIDSAVKNGAVAVVVEKDATVPEGITCIKADNTRHTLASMSTQFYNNPSEKMRLIGVISSNSKQQQHILLKAYLRHRAAKQAL